MHRPPLPDIYGLVPTDGRAPLDGATLRFRRLIVDRLGLPDTCPRPRCRTARACRARDVRCFDTRRREVVAAMEEVLHEGYEPE